MALVLSGGAVLTCDPSRHASPRRSRSGTGASSRSGATRTCRRRRRRRAERRPRRGHRAARAGRHPPARHALRGLRRAARRPGGRVDHEDIVARIAAKAAETPPGEWVMTTPVGEPHYFIRRSWRDLARGPRCPTREVLDRATQRAPGDHPGLGADDAERARAQLAGPRACSGSRRDAGAGRPGDDREGRGRRSRPGCSARRGQQLLLERAVHRGADARSSRCSTRPRSARAPSARCASYNAMGVTCAYEGHAMDFPLIAAYQWLRGEDRLTLRVLCCPEAQPYGHAVGRGARRRRVPRRASSRRRRWSSAPTTCCASTA